MNDGNRTPTEQGEKDAADFLMFICILFFAFGLLVGFLLWGAS